MWCKIALVSVLLQLSFGFDISENDNPQALVQLARVEQPGFWTFVEDSSSNNPPIPFNRLGRKLFKLPQTLIPYPRTGRMLFDTDILDYEESLMPDVFSWHNLADGSMADYFMDGKTLIPKRANAAFPPRFGRKKRSISDEDQMEHDDSERAIGNNRSPKIPSENMHGKNILQPDLLDNSMHKQTSNSPGVPKRGIDKFLRFRKVHVSKNSKTVKNYIPKHTSNTNAISEKKERTKEKMSKNLKILSVPKMGKTATSFREILKSGSNIQTSDSNGRTKHDVSISPKEFISSRGKRLTKYRETLTTKEPSQTSRTLGVAKGKSEKHNKFVLSKDRLIISSDETLKWKVPSQEYNYLGVSQGLPEKYETLSPEETSNSNGVSKKKGKKKGKSKILFKPRVGKRATTSEGTLKEEVRKQPSDSHLVSNEIKKHRLSISPKEFISSRGKRLTTFRETLTTKVPNQMSRILGVSKGKSEKHNKFVLSKDRLLITTDETLKWKVPSQAYNYLGVPQGVPEKYETLSAEQPSNSTGISKKKGKKKGKSKILFKPRVGKRATTSKITLNEEERKQPPNSPLVSDEITKHRLSISPKKFISSRGKRVPSSQGALIRKARNRLPRPSVSKGKLQKHSKYVLSKDKLVVTSNETLKWKVPIHLDSYSGPYKWIPDKYVTIPPNIFIASRDKRDNASQSTLTMNKPNQEPTSSTVSEDNSSSQGTLLCNEQNRESSFPEVSNETTVIHCQFIPGFTPRLGKRNLGREVPNWELSFKEVSKARTQKYDDFSSKRFSPRVGKRAISSHETLQRKSQNQMSSSKEFSKKKTGKPLNGSIYG